MLPSSARLLDLLRMDPPAPEAVAAGWRTGGRLLQTLIAALAVANRPDEFSFVLVDYKGGAAFKDCMHLPHTVGMVTDLDGHLTERALASLDAELRRRNPCCATSGARTSRVTRRPGCRVGRWRG